MTVRKMVSPAAVPCPLLPLGLLGQDSIPLLRWACRGLHSAWLLRAVYQEPCLLPPLLPPAGLNWKLVISWTEFASPSPHRTHGCHLLASPASSASRTNVTSHLRTIWAAAPHVGGSDLTLSREEKPFVTHPGCPSSHCPSH